MEKWIISLNCYKLKTLDGLKNILQYTIFKKIITNPNLELYPISNGIILMFLLTIHLIHLSTSASKGLGYISEQNEQKTLSFWTLYLPQVNLWKKLSLQTCQHLLNAHTHTSWPHIKFNYLKS